VTIYPGVAAATPAQPPAAAPQPNPQARGQIRPAAVGVVDSQPQAAPAASPNASAQEAHGRTAGAALSGQDFGPPGIDRWLRMLSVLNGSDLHLSCANPPKLRLHGEIQNLEDGPILEHDKLKSMLFQIMPPKLNREEFDRRCETPTGRTRSKISRATAATPSWTDAASAGCSVSIPFEILHARSSSVIPRPVLDLCNLTKGLVVVTGPTGSGKSTTLATLIDVINQSRDDHIITIEDPIEFVHDNKRCLVNQREVRVHTHSLQRTPCVPRSAKTRTSCSSAKCATSRRSPSRSRPLRRDTSCSGRSTRTTAPSTVDRIIDQFPSDRQAQIRTMLSESLKGVIAQVLCKKKTGGRAAAYEILIGTPAIANLIREGKTFQIPGVMQTSRAVGMCTMGDSLIDLLKKGVIEPKEAYMKSINKSEMRGLLTSNGFTLPELGK
jgi:twitching motility protein PilT